LSFIAGTSVIEFSAVFSFRLDDALPFRLQREWLLRYLMRIHAKLELIGNFPSEHKDTPLFFVQMPD
jgi:hypothetical protein